MRMCTRASEQGSERKREKAVATIKEKSLKPLISTGLQILLDSDKLIMWHLIPYCGKILKNNIIELNLIEK